MLGVGIISFNRPGYLRRLMASLEAQTDLRDCDFWLFQDGAVNRFSGNRYALDKDINGCVRTFARSKLPNKWSVLHEQNVGVAINSFEALEELTGNYERVILLEDDVVLSPHWFRLVRILFDDLARRPDVFSAAPGFRAESADLDAVAYGWTHMWAECFLPERWREIRAFYLDTYYPFVADCDYVQRNQQAIAEMYAHYGITAGLEGLALSQDGGRQLAMTQAGMRRAYLPVNRAIGIGRHGLHFTPELFSYEGFDRPGPFIHESDATREGFTWPA